MKGFIRSRTFLGIVGGIIGCWLGAVLGGFLAYGVAALTMPAPEPRPSHGLDPIAMIETFGDLAARAARVLMGVMTGGMIGAIGGAIFGVTRVRPRDLSVQQRTAPRSPADEIALLQARIAELEQSRDSGGAL